MTGGGAFTPQDAFIGSDAAFFIADQEHFTFDSGTDISNWAAKSGSDFNMGASANFAGFDSAAFGGKGGIGNGSGGVASLISDAAYSYGTGQAIYLLFETGATISGGADMFGFGSSSAMNTGNRLQVLSNNNMVWDDEQGTNTKITFDSGINNRDATCLIMRWVDADTVEIFVNSKTKNASDLNPDDTVTDGTFEYLHIGRKLAWDANIKLREFGFAGGGLTDAQINSLMDYASAEYGFFLTDESPAISHDFLSDSASGSFQTVRAGSAISIETDGKFKSSAANVVRFNSAFLTGDKKGVRLEEERTAYNHYARPSADTVADHFSTGDTYASIVTDSSAPLRNSITNHDDVWEIENDTGSDIYVEWECDALSTSDEYNIQFYYKITDGDGYAVMSLAGATDTETRLEAREYAQAVITGVTPATTSDKPRLLLPAGMTLRGFFMNIQDGYTLNRYYSHPNMPIDTAGAAVTQPADVATRSSIFARTGEITFDIWGKGWGGGNNNIGLFTLYNSSDNDDYLHVQLKDTGELTIVAANTGGQIFSQSFGTPQPTPVQIGLSIRIENGSFAVAYLGEIVFESSDTGLNIENLDTLLMAREDNASRDEFTWDLEGFDIYYAGLKNSDLEKHSKKKNGFVAFTAGQSNTRLLNEANSDGGKGAAEIEMEKIFDPYVSNYYMIPAAPNTLGGSIFKANRNINGMYFYDEDLKVRGNAYLGVRDLVTGQVDPLLVEAIYWDQWQFDLELELGLITYEEYEDATEQVMIWFKEDFPNATIYNQAPAQRRTTNDTTTYNFRKSYDNVDSRLSYFVTCYHPYQFGMDTAGTNKAHYFPDDYRVMGEGDARFTLDHKGIVDLGNVVSPTISGATYSGSVITLAISGLENGAELTADTTNSPFRVMQGETELTVSSWTISTNTISLQMSADVGGEAEVDFPFYFHSDTGDANPREDSAFGIPLASAYEVAVVSA